MATTTSSTVYVTSGTATSYSGLWATWCTSTTSTATSTWDIWVSNSTAETFVFPAYEETAEERREREETARRVAQEIKERERAKRQAKNKAKQLLREALNNKQRNRFDRYGNFYVRGPSGQLYRINPGRVANVEVIDKRKTKHRLCAHVRDNVPDFDNMLAQKIMLEHFEDDFLRIANIH